MLQPNYDYKAPFAQLGTSRSAKDYVPYLKLLLTYLQNGLLTPNEIRLSHMHRTCITEIIIGGCLHPGLLDADWTRAQQPKRKRSCGEYLTEFLHKYIGKETMEIASTVTIYGMA